MSKYTEVIAGNAAAIFCDGEIMSITEILAALNAAQPPCGAIDVASICNAYESGVGHHGRPTADVNPYAVGTPEHQAYQIGAHSDQPAAPVAPATVAVPGEKYEGQAPSHITHGYAWCQGWNACRKEMLASHPQAAQAVPVDAVALAYGILWHANNMRPGYDAPAGHERLTPEKAAYKARHVLRDLLTRDQLGDGINRASDMLAARQREGGVT